MAHILTANPNELTASWHEYNFKTGVREWMTKRELIQKFGQEGAEAIISRKESDPELKSNEVRGHPDAPELSQYLTLNMDKVTETEETTIARLFKATEEDSSSSSSSSKSSASSSSSDKKKKKKADRLDHCMHAILRK